MVEELSWSRLAPAFVLLVVLLLQIVSRFMSQSGRLESLEAKLRNEIKSIHQEANALSGPSTFAQSAKMMRVAARKEKELAQLKEQAKQKKPFGVFVLLKAGTYIFLAWGFWNTPLATVPADLLQPFAHILSWPTKFSESESNLIKIGIIPWLLLATRASSYIVNSLLRTGEKLR